MVAGPLTRRSGAEPGQEQIAQLLQMALANAPALSKRMLVLGDLADRSLLRAYAQTVVPAEWPPPHHNGTSAAQNVRLPLPDERFHIILAWGILGHGPSPESLAQEAQRLLRPGGLLALVEPLGGSGPHRARRLLSHFLEVGPVGWGGHAPRQRFWSQKRPTHWVLQARRRRLEDVAGHFESLAPEYWQELPAHVQHHYLERKIATIERGLPPQHERLLGLDLGCGIGQYAEALTRRLGVRVVGMDASRPSLALARQRQTGPRQPHFLAADSLRLPFRDASFDFAFIINVLHHLKRGEQERALGEIHRVLRPGAPLFVLEMNIRNPLFRFYLRVIYPKTRRIDRGDEEFIHPDRHPVIPGFRLERIDYTTFMPDFLPAFLLDGVKAVERMLEQGRARRYSMHYAATLYKGSQAPQTQAAAAARADVGSIPSRSLKKSFAR